MKKQILVALATMSAAMASPSYAASSDELAEIREQLQSLSQRVDKLEAENNALKLQNEELKAQGENLEPQSPGLQEDSGAEAPKDKEADWASRVALKGDLRYRYEQISDATLNSSGVQSTADRYRERVRARIAAEIKATDNITFGIGFATNEGGDPRSANQTLGGIFSRKNLNLDLAYFDWKFATWGNLIGGKMKQPFYTPGRSLFWDSDVNPEGLAVTFEQGMWFGSAYHYWVNEVSGAESTVTADTMLHGAQFGAHLPIGDSELTLGAHYYDLSSAQGRSPFYNNNAFGNTTRTVTTGAMTTQVLAHDFQVIDLMAEFNTDLGTLPLQVWADVAQNQDPDELNTAWGAGAMLGKASSDRTWEISAAYQSIEKDALFAQFIDANFAGGSSDGKGWILRAGYAPVRNWVLNATYFMNQRNMDIANSAGQQEVDYDRLQLDLNVKF